VGRRPFLRRQVGAWGPWWPCTGVGPWGEPTSLPTGEKDVLAMWATVAIPGLPQPPAAEVNPRVDRSQAHRRPARGEPKVPRGARQPRRLLHAPPTRIRASDRLVDQVPESIEPVRTSRQPSALCWGGAPVFSCPRPPQAFPGREAAARVFRSEVKRPRERSGDWYRSGVKPRGATSGR
jgi:hypothetical protein